MTRLQNTGLKVNTNKSKFYITEVEYLDYLSTRGGIKPQAKKVQEGFSYNSGQNTDWETVSSLRELIIENVDSNFEVEWSQSHTENKVLKMMTLKP